MIKLFKLWLKYFAVVIVFAEKPTVVLQLVASMRRLKVDTSFVWLLSHGWTVTDQRENHLLDFPIGNLSAAAGQYGFISRTQRLLVKVK